MSAALSTSLVANVLDAIRARLLGMSEQTTLPALGDLSGTEQLQHLDHPDHPVHVVHGAALVDFKQACEWHDSIHVAAVAERYNLGHQHQSPSESAVGG